jgi:yecA family protein
VGAASVSTKKSKSTKPVNDSAIPLSAEERNELELLMESRHPDGPLGASITCLHGFLTSVVSGPLILPSEWMPTVFGGPEEFAWKDIEQARRVTTLLTRFNNEVADDLLGDGREYNVLLDCVGDAPDDRFFGDEWCRGYILGMLLREAEWKPAIDEAKLSEFLDPIFAIASPEHAGLEGLEEDQARYDEMLDELPLCAVAIYDWWRWRFAPSGTTEPIRRASPKLSPNALCPCGSGKKYKRCCSPLRAT